jgi:hypothetical protein
VPAHRAAPAARAARAARAAPSDPRQRPGACPSAPLLPALHRPDRAPGERPPAACTTWTIWAGSDQGMDGGTGPMGIDGAGTTAVSAMQCGVAERAVETQGAGRTVRQRLAEASPTSMTGGSDDHSRPRLEPGDRHAPVARNRPARPADARWRRHRPGDGCHRSPRPRPMGPRRRRTRDRPQPLPRTQPGGPRPGPDGGGRRDRPEPDERHRAP